MFYLHEYKKIDYWTILCSDLLFVSFAGRFDVTVGFIMVVFTRLVFMCFKYGTNTEIYSAKRVDKCVILTFVLSWVNTGLFGNSGVSISGFAIFDLKLAKCFPICDILFLKSRAKKE